MRINPVHFQPVHFEPVQLNKVHLNSMRFEPVHLYSVLSGHRAMIERLGISAVLPLALFPSVPCT